jgi:signal transduction histidine kinase
VLAKPKGRQTGAANVSPAAQLASRVGRRSKTGEVDQVDHEIRRQNAALIEEVARLTEAVAARDTFLAVAAHELRNPMTPIIGRVQMLRHAAGRPDFQIGRLVENLDQIEWLIAHYLKRATTLLDVSRITSGKLSLSQAPVDLCVVAREVAANFRPLAQYAGSDLDLRLPGESLVVSGDHLAIEEILDNLVSNAIKYGANTPISLDIRADRKGRFAMICVEDRGPGISADKQARIFERFERAVQPGEHRGGFGVGLWIVRQLCEAMEGAVTVHSKLGRGSTFCVTLPLQSSKDPK